MKRISIVLAAALAATLSFAQSNGLEQLHENGPGVSAPANNDDRVVTGDWVKVDDYVSDWVEYDRKSNTTTIKEGSTGTVHHINGQLRLGPLPCDTWLDNYYLNKKTGIGTPHGEKLKAGTLVWFDESNNPICKASCKNPLGFSKEVQAKIVQQCLEIYRQRDHVMKFERQVDHYHTEYRDVPVPEYHLVRIYGPQNQYVGQLAAPTVVQGGGGGGISVNLGTRNSLTAYGGNGYGAAAAAAAAAASSSSTAVTPTSGAGTSGGSSGGSSSGAGGGPSNSGSGSH